MVPPDSMFCFGAVAGILLAILVMLPLLLRKKKPDVPTERDWRIAISNMTRRKALGLLADKPNAVVSGFIITRSETQGSGLQDAAIVFQSGVRWAKPTEMWELMHPTPPELAQARSAAMHHLTTPPSSGVAPLDHYATLIEENSPEYSNQLRFDFTKIRSVKDTIEDLKDLVDLTTWQQDCVSRSAIWLTGLSNIDDAWWQKFIEYVDTLTTQPEHKQTRESLIELVSRVVAHPADAL
jgi:hypothetical protein